MAGLIGCCCELTLKLCCNRYNEEARKETERELVAELVAAGIAVTERQVDVRDTVTKNHYAAAAARTRARRQDGTSLGLLSSGSTVQVLSSYEAEATIANCLGDLPPSVWYLEVVPPDNLQPPKGAASGGDDLSQGMTAAAAMASSSSGWVRLDSLGYLKKYNVAPAGK
jgi:hypothetical protein